MSEAPNVIVLIGYLEEALPAEEMARIEENLRQDPAWRQALASIVEEVDPGDHSVATIWRRHRLTCVTREKLGAFLLQGLIPTEEEYIRFHLDVIQCRWCQSNLEDIRNQHDQQASVVSSQRRQRLFQTSVGQVAKKEGSR